MDDKVFFDEVRSSLFNGRLTQSQVENISYIISAFNALGDGSKKTLAYALATAYHEVGINMAPVREGFKKTDAEARAYVKSKGYRYALAIPPYNHVYYGRGYVQLTWADNYKKSSEDAGVDLFQFPDEILKPEIGAKILIKGLQDGIWNGKGFGISHYLPLNGPDDLMNARRTVNITDKWQLIGGHYTKFLKAIEKAGGIEKTIVEIEPPIENDEDSVRKLKELIEWRAGLPDEYLDHFIFVADYLKRIPRE